MTPSQSETCMEGGAGPNDLTNVGGGDRGTRLTVAEGVVLRATVAGETPNEWHNSDGGVRELPPDMWGGAR